MQRFKEVLFEMSTSQQRKQLIHLLVSKITINIVIYICNDEIYSLIKARDIVSRGGKFSKGPAAMLEMGDRYLKSIFAFFGITDFTSIVAEGLDARGVDVESIIEDKIKEAKEVAKEF